MTIPGFLALSLDAQNLTQQSNLQLLQTKNSLKVDDMTTKLAAVGSAWQAGPEVLNSVGVLDTMFVFGLVFIL